MLVVSGTMHCDPLLTYAAVSVMPNPPHRGVITYEMNSYVSEAMGPPPVRINLNWPPTISRAPANLSRRVFVD